MRGYRQWICWRYEYRGDNDKPTKVPYNPRTGALASVTDHTTWVSFEEATAMAANGYDGIGFVLTKDDPYCFIDLDDTHGNQKDLDRQIKVHQEFASYSERSPSGQGLHIIIKARVPTGRRRNFIELYSSERYMTMTGDVFNAAPIAEHQELAQLLWAQMGGGADKVVYDGNAPQTMTDAEVLEKASNAANGEKFTALRTGRWSDYYPSQSEADFAYIDIIAFYTQNREQIVRLFHLSPLGVRAKAQRPGYVNAMVNRAFDNLLPPIDIVMLKEAAIGLSSGGAEATGPAPATPPIESEALQAIKEFWKPQRITPPPGLLGEIAQYIFRAAPRPVPEMAIVGAIGLLAGIVGRAYNVSGTGLNQYCLLLAPTGTGKESITGGISRLMHAIQFKVPAASEFIGPSELASGQALLKQVAKTPCFVSIIGEFGLKMQQLANPRASTSEIMLKKVLLDLYNKSGKLDMVGSTAHADKSKDTESVRAPNVTLMGEATPHTFYSVLDEGLITDGLLPRFLIIEYRGPRVPRNKFAKDAVPDETLVDKIADTMVFSFSLQRENEAHDVGYTADALQFLDSIDTMADSVINSTQDDALRDLWNRAHIKTLKLAALVAVGVNPVNPVIDLAAAQWAYNLVAVDILGIVQRFSAGEVGKNTEESQQTRVLKKLFIDYLRKNHNEVSNYGVDKEMHADKIVPYVYLARRGLIIKEFKNDKMGAANALKRALQLLLDSGEVQEVGRGVLMDKYKKGGRAFMLASFDKPSAEL